MKRKSGHLHFPDTSTFDPFMDCFLLSLQPNCETDKTMLHLNKVHHIAIICSDYQKSLDFYTRVLGFKVIAEHYRAERQSYKTDLALDHDYIIELFSFPSPPRRLTHPEAAGMRHLAFEVDNIAAAIGELDALGITHEQIRIDEYTGKQFLFFQDPDGLPIELYEK